MNEHTIIRKDENLLRLAKEVFGDDLVTDAFITTWFCDDGKPEDSE
jgi:hypothetical protein